MSKILITVYIYKEPNWYVAKCLENDVASQGKTVEEAVVNLKEAVALYYEDEDKSAIGDIFSQEAFTTRMEVAI